MDNSDWDLMASVWVSVDRTQHALSNYVGPDHPDYARNSQTAVGAKVRDVYKQLDDAIGSFVSRTRPDDLILFISDHGFQSVTRTLHMDHLLKKLGFLEHSASNMVFGPMQWGPVRNVARKVYDLFGLHGKVSLPQSVNWSKTKAFTTIRTTGEGVSINLAGREPDGIVDPADFEKVRDQVMDALGSFVDPKTGRKPVKAIYKREEIFKGKYAETAPDILLEPAEQYSLTHAKTALEDADWISGDHRIEGVIVAAGPNVKPFEQPPLLIDMAPTILAALGAPSTIEHTGRVLHEVVGSEAKVSRGDSFEPAVAIPGMTSGDEKSNVTDTEADEMEEHLRGLGYLE
jgi:predicted AlkP superfamily phosphohydrolase/phosphomutase